MCCSERAVTDDEDAKVIYPDYRRSAVAIPNSEDEDAKVIYPDYRRGISVSSRSEEDEDAKVIYPDY